MKIKKYFDLNILLRVANLFLCFLGIVIYNVKGGNQYVDINTIFLLCIFCVQNVVFLFYEKRESDPFIIMLVAYVTLFYVVRIVTLLNNTYSVVLSRNAEFSFQSLNDTLLFIMFSNIAIFLGLACGARARYIQKITPNVGIAKIAHPLNILLVLFVAVCVNFFGIFLTNHLGRFVCFVQVFVMNLAVIILFSCVYFASNYKYFSKTYLYVFGALLLIFVSLSTLVGSRSGMLTLLICVFIAYLSIKKRIQFKAKYFFVSIAIVLASFVLFNLATKIRSSIGKERVVIGIAQVNVIKKTNILSSQDRFTDSLRVFDRIGFLDYSADTIINSDRYKKIINFDYYFKSIIDNCLTPGFNVFGVPKVSNALMYIYKDLPEPTHDDINKAYQADMLTLYGDYYYVLFGGYFALIVFFVLAFLFKTAFNLPKNKDVFLYYLSRSIILYVFYFWLNDFGIDWMFWELICIVITFTWLKIFYKMGTKRFVYRLP